MVQDYLASGPDPALYEFLQARLRRTDRDRSAACVGTTFRNFPSFPQRYMETVDLPAADPCVRVEPLKPPSQPVVYTEDDLHVRQFTGDQLAPPDRRTRGQDPTSPPTSGSERSTAPRADEAGRPVGGPSRSTRTTPLDDGAWTNDPRRPRSRRATRPSRSS